MQCIDIYIYIYIYIVGSGSERLVCALDVCPELHLQDASNLFLVMEFMQGGSLATHLSRSECGDSELCDPVSIAHLPGSIFSLFCWFATWEINAMLKIA